MRCIYVAGREGALFSDSIRSSVQLSRIKVRKTLERKVWIITARRDSGLGLLSVAQAQDPEVEATRITSAALTFHLNSFARWLTGEQRQRIFLCSLVRTHCDIIPTRLSGYACANINRVDFEVAKYSKSGFENVNRIVPPRRPGQSLIAKGLTTWDFCPTTPSDQIRSASYFYWPP